MIAALALSLALGAAADVDVGVVFTRAAGASELIAACPRVAFVDASTGAADLLHGYLAACPGGIAAFQLPAATLTPFVGSLDGARSQAAAYWSVVAPLPLAPLSQLSAGERAAVWLGGPRDFDSFPSWRTDPCGTGAVVCAAEYVGAFWAELDRLARADGWRGLVLPPYAPLATDRPGALCDVLLGIDQQRSTDAAWTWDAVSPALAQSAVEESATTFGYRAIRTACGSARAHPLLVRVSVAGGWQTRTTATGFLDWLRWLDGEVDKDPDPFLGLAVHGYGTGDANDLAPVASQLAAYIVNPSAPPDGSGGGTNGGVGPGTPPGTTPGSNLGPGGGGSGGGCSTAGSPGALAVVAVAVAMLRPRKRDRATG